MSSEGKYNMDRDFHNLFNDWEAQPSPDAWEKIERRLDGEDKKKPFLWWWFGGIALLIILGIGATWLLWPNNNASVIQQTSLAEKSQNVSNGSENTNKDNRGNKDLSKPSSLSKQDSIKTEVIKGSLVNNKENKIVSKKISPINTVNTHVGKYDYPVANVPNNKSKKVPIALNNIDTEKISDSKEIEQNDMVIQEGTENKIIASASNDQKIITAKADSEKPKPITQLSEIKDSASAKGSRIMEVALEDKQTEPNAKNMDSSNIKQEDTVLKPKTDSTFLVKTDSIVPKNKVSVSDTVQKADTIAKVTKDTTKAKKANANFFSFSIYGAPELSNNMITTNNTGFDIKSEKTNLQFAGGLRVSYNLSNRVGLSISAAYSQVNINYQSNQNFYVDRYLSQPYVFSSSYGDMAIPAATMLQGFSQLAPPSVTMFMLRGYRYSQTMQFLNIPINIRFNITTGKLKTYASLGLNIQCALSETAELDLIKELETDVTKFNSLNTTKLNYAPTIAIGAQYDFAKHVGVFLEPNARYNLMSSSTNTAVKSNASFISCSIGLRISL